ncbi:MAG TPA: PAS domain S-box protein [Bryobacteraceae bacterium]|nr:PAS domain S-box protein [Bryobacteraceae bacterium]
MAVQPTSIPGPDGQRLRDSNAQFQAMWDQGLFACRVDLAGRVLDGNRACLEDCGFTRAQVAGKPFWECGWWNRSADVQQRIRGAVEQAIQGTAFRGASRYWLADGSEREIQLSCLPIRDDSGRVIFVVLNGMDITEREGAPASALLAAIVDSCDDAIISKNLNGIITSWNQGAERLFGYTAQEMIGKSILTLIPQKMQDEEPRILAQLRKGERIDHYETTRVCKDGSLRNLSLTISPMKDASGRIVGASKVARDITERVRHEQAMREANAALKRANADLEQFAYSASHDLQEPLRMISTYSELLRKKFGGKLGPMGDEYIGHAVDGALRMASLLRDLRAYTQVSTVHHEPPGEVDSGEILRKTLLNLQVAIHDSGVTVTTSEMPRVRMFEFQLEQVFQNLVGNAIGYRGNDPPRVHVAAEAQGDHWLFSVRDNGIGIEPQFKEQVFGIFKRLHSASEHPGTGMGLAICQRIIERAGGRIWVESEPGRGSTFYFTVPRGESGRGEPGDPGRLDSADRGQSGGRRAGARSA